MTMDSEGLDVMKMKSSLNPDLASVIQDVQQDKVAVKTSYVFVKSKKQFLKSIYMEPAEWLTKEEADKELEDATEELQEIKMEMKSVKEMIQSLCESTEEGYTLLTQNQSLLEEKKNELEKKKKQLAECKKRCTEPDVKQSGNVKDIIDNLTKKIASVEASIQKCDTVMCQVKQEVGEIDPSINILEKTLTRNSRNLDKITAQQKAASSLLTDFTQKLEQLVKDVEKLGGVTVVPLSHTALRVEFPASSSNESDVQLALSLEFNENNLGSLSLKSAQVNLDSIDASEMLNQAVAMNDVPTLVTRLKSRWLSHQPLLLEISHLRLRSAVDWIQEESLLRVMVGKGGCIVCTLIVPPCYPLSGEVTLTDIKGASECGDISDIKPSSSEKTLTSWVACLEQKFGRP